VKINARKDMLDELIGFRTIETPGKELLLKRKSIFLRGTAVHAEAPDRTARANRDQHMESLSG
jgi:beta-glucuronidase